MQDLTKINFADQAEKVICSLIKTDRRGQRVIGVTPSGLTTSKIRNLLSMTNVLYGRACKLKGSELNEDIQKDMQYLKMRFVYEAGRDKDVDALVKSAHIIENINKIGNSREKLLVLCNYIEALVAYHKYYGGKDR